MLRLLTEQEIDILENNGCSAEDWSRIKVGNGFLPENIQRTKFYGDIRLLGNNGTMLLDGVVATNCGVYDSVLHNCEIGKDSYIERVSMLSNYNVSANCVIRNVVRLAVVGETSFGNGVEVSVMDETGGRKIAIHNKLSAVMAYTTVFYRYNDELVNVVQHLVADYVASITTKQGFVGEGSIIEGCGNIINVRVGEATELEQVTHLENGSINSTSVSPISIRNGVIAKDFIISCGSKLHNNVQVERCFIGEACRLANGFIAHDSLIFANSQLECGEACAIFAAPYTVSMHKSTLLIGGLFSFFNAGSGSNQSNHLYKLGPIHYGITERGVKLASNSYILWPARIGAFSMVMGSIYNHPDTSKFPFSYIIEKRGELFLVPGAALRSAGTHRDVRKWPKRDERKSTEPIDSISFEWLSPYTIGYCVEAREALLEIRKNNNPANGYYTIDDVFIKSSALEQGIELYTMAIRSYISGCIKKYGELGNGTLEQWLDLAGLLAPKSEVKHFIALLCNDASLNMAKVSKMIRTLHAGYDTWCKQWSGALARYEYGTEATLTEMLESGERAKASLLKMALDDASKEFAPASTVGFGRDTEREEDFIKDVESVRGTLEENPLVCTLIEEILQL